MSNKDLDFLIVGLGNPEPERKNTRHNIGFLVINELATEYAIDEFQPCLKADYTTCFIARKRVMILRPTTGMNTIGDLLSYYRQMITTDKILVIVDDISLPFGEIKLKMNGSSGGHNGLKSIEEKIGQGYPRIKFGIGSNYEKGKQLDYVLGEWTDAEMSALPEKISAMKNKIVDYIKNAK